MRASPRARANEEKEEKMKEGKATAAMSLQGLRVGMGAPPQSTPVPACNCHRGQPY